MAEVMNDGEERAAGLGDDAPDVHAVSRQGPCLGGKPQLSKSRLRSLDGQPRTPAPFPGSHLVEANQAHLPTEVNALRTDAENALAFQPALSVHGAHGHRRWQGWGNDHRHDVQSTDGDQPLGNLPTVAS